MSWLSEVCGAITRVVSLETVVSVVIGGVISLAGSWFFGANYYRRAAKDLTHEAGKLRALVEIVYGALKSPHAQLLRNEKGDVLGLALSSTDSIKIAVEESTLRS